MNQSYTQSLNQSYTPAAENKQTFIPLPVTSVSEIYYAIFAARTIKLARDAIAINPTVQNKAKVLDDFYLLVADTRKTLVAALSSDRLAIPVFNALDDICLDALLIASGRCGEEVNAKYKLLPAFKVAITSHANLDNVAASNQDINYKLDDVATRFLSINHAHVGNADDFHIGLPNALSIFNTAASNLTASFIQDVNFLNLIFSLAMQKVLLDCPLSYYGHKYGKADVNAYVEFIKDMKELHNLKDYNTMLKNFLEMTMQVSLVYL